MTVCFTSTLPAHRALPKCKHGQSAPAHIQSNALPLRSTSIHHPPPYSYYAYFSLSSLFPRITFSTCVRDLGVMLDPELTFSHHINLVARKCYYQLHQLRVVFRSLTHQSTLTLVHAFVTSRFDSCSSLLAGLPLGTLAR